MNTFPFGLLRCRVLRLAVAVVLLATGGVTRAQTSRPPPHIAFVYPAGGQQGTTFPVVLSGQFLAETSAAYVSGTGISAQVVGYERPLTGKESNELKDELEKLRPQLAALAQSGATAPPAADAAAREKLSARIQEIETQLARRNKTAANPGLAETVTLQLTIAADAPLGNREIRLKTPLGLSNPLVFCMGQLPEITAPAAIVTNDPAAGRKKTAPTAKASPPTDVTLPAVLNGQIMPGEVDRYRFTAKRGQRLTIVAQARALIPYLADAVPGWFQATLALYDSQGHELAYDDDFRFNPDPALAYTIKTDGQYTVAIKDAIYRGREDFVYRITLGELPFITSIFPLGGRAGTVTSVEILGWNLPVDKVALDAPPHGATDMTLSVLKDGVRSNSVRFAVDQLPECRETEPNDTRNTAQIVTLPVILNGRINRADDVDVLAFDGKAGEEIVAEVLARRLNSPLDSVLRLLDADGREIATNDDHDDKAAALVTHQADSRLNLTLPATGRYYLCLGDTQHHGGPDYTYRLVLGPPRPNFSLRVVPASISLTPGANVPLTVYALRNDGFAGPIELGLLDAGRDFALSGARIPAGGDQIKVTLTAFATPREAPLTLRLGGRAEIDGQTITHLAVPAEDMMQAFAYRHLVPAQILLGDLHPGEKRILRILSPTPIRIPSDGSTQLQIAVVAGKQRFEALEAELVNPPPGVSLETASVNLDRMTLTLRCDASKVRLGQQGNLLIQLHASRAAKNQPKAAKSRPNTGLSLGYLPAVPYEISPTKAAQASKSPKNDATQR